AEGGPLPALLDMQKVVRMSQVFRGGSDRRMSRKARQSAEPGGEAPCRYGTDAAEGGPLPS
ncbi:MAG: hypothetical protein ACRDJ4_03065, partial [Actinomycetota bacterium]